jgi:hypothetical protein
VGEDGNVREWWRRWRYKRYEARVSSTDDFEQFDQFASGSWTPEMVSKMPWDVLVKGPQLGGIDAQTRRVIDMEMARRAQPISPIIANIIAALALIISIVALSKSS